ncbi:hypothetical protein JTB14_035230 [Gonioctena quinquepunctata]|nr:hypothetical protein JTB14_035230 [Gonioctena quinquepunctata]
MKRLQRSSASPPRSVYNNPFPDSALKLGVTVRSARILDPVIQTNCHTVNSALASSFCGSDTSKPLPAAWESCGTPQSLRPLHHNPRRETHCPPWQNLAVPKKPTSREGLSEPRLIRAPLP